MQKSGTRPYRRQRRAAQNGAAAAASGAALTLGVALAAVPPAEGAAFNVGNLADSGAGSLRQAILDANAAAGPDVITFQAGLSGTITLTTGQLAVTDSLDVQGPGAAVISVSGNGASRVFYLYSNAAEIDVTISGLTVTGGVAADTGGGIFVRNENLVLDGVTLAGNTASVGGGLSAVGKDALDVTLRNSTFADNAAGIGGGALINGSEGPLLIQSTVITGNEALQGQGGGIALYNPGSDTTIEGSTISGNTALGNGGGLFVYFADGVVGGGTHTIRDTTLSGNTAANGGGVFLLGIDVPFVLENSTVSGNQASGNGGGVFFYNLYEAGAAVRHSTIAANSAAGSGGGLFAVRSAVTVEHTIVADNTAGGGPDLSTSMGSFDVSFSLIEAAAGTVGLNDGGGNVFNQDPQLGPLANNGGPTQTHLPAGTSPAVNAGDPAFVPPPAADQRGFDRVAGGRIDIGAVEVNAETEVPALGGIGKVLLAALCGFGGFLLLRRKKLADSASGPLPSVDS